MFGLLMDLVSRAGPVAKEGELSCELSLSPVLPQALLPSARL
jgi:hypothetical protein